MKKRVLLAVLAIAMVFVLVACAAPKQAAEWSISVEGADVSAFTNADYAKLNEVSFTAVLKNKAGEKTEQECLGVRFADIVQAIGAGEYVSISVEAADGYTQDYTPDVVNDEKTILATAIDGKSLVTEESGVQTVAGNYPGNLWIRDVVRITVNK